MKITAIVEALVSAGATPEMILCAVRAAESQSDDALEKRRQNDRDRKSRQREAEALSRDVTGSHNDRQPPSPHVRADDAPATEENKQTNKPERKQDSAPVARGGLKEFADELSSVLNTERVDAIIAVRRKKGAVLSAHAARILVKALLSCPDPRAAADEMVLRNWTGIKPDWLESRSRQNGHSPPNGKRQNAVEAMEEIFRDKGWTQENEPEFVPSHNRDAQFLPSERRSEQGAVVDLRPGADWRSRSGH